jgi:hypothetical protein
MKHSLRYCFVLLALATTGLFAETTTAPVETAPTGQHKTVKAEKKAKKAAHKKHRKHQSKKADQQSGS